MSPVILGLGASSSPPPPDPVTRNATVGSQNDGTYISVWNSWRETGDNIYIHDREGRDHNTNLRFTGLEIPRNATITDARITLYARGTWTGGGSGGDYVVVGAEQVDNATAITTFAAHNTRRSNVGVTVSWPIVNRSPNQALVSPDLSAVVQQIVNRGGWPDGTGGAIQFFLQDSEVANLAWNVSPHVQSYSTNNGSQYLPALEITYIE